MSFLSYYRCKKKQWGVKMGYYGRGLFTANTSGGRESNYYLYQTINQLLLEGERETMKINLETEEIKSVLFEFEREFGYNSYLDTPGSKATWFYHDKDRYVHRFKTLDEIVSHFLKENNAKEFQLIPVKVDNSMVVGYRLLMKVEKKDNNKQRITLQCN